MTKHIEPIPFMGMVEVEDSDVRVDRNLYFRTQQEVADELGISRTAVLETEKRALEKFKKLFLSKFNRDDFI